MALKLKYSLKCMLMVQVYVYLT